MQYPDYPITTSVTAQIVTDFTLSSPYTERIMFALADLTVRRLSILLLLTTAVFGQSSASFSALLNWKAVLIRGNLSALKELYSTHPLARVTVVVKNPTEISVQQDAEFWAGLKARRVSLNVSQSSSPQPGLQQVTFEATITPTLPGRTLYVLESQLWQQQGSVWKLVAVERTDAYRLEQPLSLDAKL